MKEDVLTHTSNGVFHNELIYKRYNGNNLKSLEIGHEWKDTFKYYLCDSQIKTRNFLVRLKQ